MGLNVEDLDHAIASEDVVIAADTLVETQAAQQSAQIAEADVGIRIPAEHPVKRLRDFTQGFTDSRAGPIYSTAFFSST
jgi:hypothetical protein